MKFSYPKKSTASTATIILFLFVNIGLSAQSLQKTVNPVLSVTSAVKTNSTTVDLLLNNKYHLLLDFYNENIFRVFFDSSNSKPHDPVATPAAQILVGNLRRKCQHSNVIVMQGM